MSRHRPDPSPADERRQAYRLGLTAETRAAWWLRLKGYRILARRHARGTAELDIIAKRGRTLAFVEVKARPTLADGMFAVTTGQRRRILRAAEGFVAHNPRYHHCDLRFDIVVVPPRGRPHHLPGAFDATR